MIVLGYEIAIAGARRGFLGQFPNETGSPSDPLAFLIIGLGDLLLFLVFFALGFYYRSKPEIHKRLMLLATILIAVLCLTVAVLTVATGRGGARSRTIRLGARNESARELLARVLTTPSGGVSSFQVEYMPGLGYTFGYRTAQAEVTQNGKAMLTPIFIRKGN